MNPGPLRPERSALPSCATPRQQALGSIGQGARMQYANATAAPRRHINYNTAAPPPAIRPPTTWGAGVWGLGRWRFGVESLPEASLLHHLRHWGCEYLFNQRVCVRIFITVAKRPRSLPH